MYLNKKPLSRFRRVLASAIGHGANHVTHSHMTRHASRISGLFSLNFDTVVARINFFTRTLYLICKD